MSINQKGSENMSPENYQNMSTNGVNFSTNGYTSTIGVSRSFVGFDVSVDKNGISISPNLSITDPTGVLSVGLTSQNGQMHLSSSIGIAGTSIWSVSTPMSPATNTFTNPVGDASSLKRRF